MVKKVSRKKEQKQRIPISKTEKRRSHKRLRRKQSKNTFGTFKRPFHDVDSDENDIEEDPPEKKQSHAKKATYDIFLYNISGEMMNVMVSPTTLIVELKKKIAETMKNVSYVDIKLFRLDVPEDDTASSSNIRINDTGTVEDEGIKENEMISYVILFAKGIERFQDIANVHEWKHKSTERFIVCNHCNVWQRLNKGKIMIEDNAQKTECTLKGYLIGPNSISFDETKLIVSTTDPMGMPGIEYDDTGNVWSVYVYQIWDISVPQDITEWNLLQTIHVRLNDNQHFGFSPDLTYFFYFHVESDEMIVGEIPHEQQDVIILPQQLTNKRKLYSEGQTKIFKKFSNDNIFCTIEGILVVSQTKTCIHHLPSGKYTTTTTYGFKDFFNTCSQALIVDKVSSVYSILDLHDLGSDEFTLEEHTRHIVRNGKCPITSNMQYQRIVSDDSYALFLVKSDDDEIYTIFALDLEEENDFYLPFEVSPTRHSLDNWEMSALSISLDQLKISTPTMIHTLSDDAES